jgi:hypothetical protein
VDRGVKIAHCLRLLIHGVAAVLIALVPGACGGCESNNSVTLEFRPDVAVGEDAYVCFGFEAGAVRDRGISGIEWERPTGAVVLHHAPAADRSPFLHSTAPLAASGDQNQKPMPARPCGRI